MTQCVRNGKLLSRKFIVGLYIFCWYPPNRLHGIRTYITTILIIIAVVTSNILVIRFLKRASSKVGWTDGNTSKNIVTMSLSMSLPLGFRRLRYKACAAIENITIQEPIERQIINSLHKLNILAYTYHMLSLGVSSASLNCHWKCAVGWDLLKEC